MDFEADIQIGEPDVVGVNHEHSGLLDVDVPLTPAPRPEWVQIFNSGPPDVPFPVSMHPPRLLGDTVRIRPPDADVDTYMEHLRLRVDGTNVYFNREIAPRLARGDAAKRAEIDERRRRVEEAQSRLGRST